MKPQTPKIHVDLAPWTTLTDEQTQGELAAFDIGADGLAYVAFATRPTEDREETSHGSFPLTTAREPQTYRVLGVSDIGCVLDVTIRGEPFHIHHVQPLGDDLLLACGRSRYRGPDDFDRNGRLYSRGGKFLREILLGDGIESLQVASDDVIWTSYFDEGVFGNFGWNEPVGSSGLVAWEASGTRLFEFAPSGSIEQICDCYALNVSSARDVWLYYYTEFPLVHLRDRKIHGVWKMPVHGSRALAVGKRFVLLDRGYERHETYALLKLNPTGQASVVARFSFSTADGTVLGGPATQGRGESLYFRNGKHLYRISIEEALKFADQS